MNFNGKKLYRSLQNKMLTGVCGGLAEYFNLDPAIIRLIMVIFGCTGAGVVFYIAASFIMPEEGR